MSQLTKKKKIIFGSTLLVLLILLGGFFLGKYLTDEQRLIHRFEQAIQDGRSDKLLKLLNPTDKDVKIEQKTADHLVSYLQSNTQVLEEITKQLDAQAKLLNQIGGQAIASTKAMSSFINLHKNDGKRWLFYADYELKLRQYTIPVLTNFDGAQITVDGTEAGVAGGDGTAVEVGPLLPGEYTIEAVYEGEYTTLKKSAKLSLFPMDEFEDTVELALEGEYVKVGANTPGARILINGEDIGLKVEDEQEIGPIVIDGSDQMQLEMDYPWGKVTSEVLPINSRELNFVVEGLNEEESGEVMNAAHAFADSWMNSLQALEPNTLLHAHPDRIADLSTFIDIMTINGQKYIGSLEKMTFDLGSLTLVRLDDGSYSVIIKAQVDANEITYHILDNLNPVPVKGSTTNEYELTYEDGQWIVVNWYETSGISKGKTKVYE